MGNTHGGQVGARPQWSRAGRSDAFGAGMILGLSVKDLLVALAIIFVVALIVLAAAAASAFVEENPDVER